jgi:hypothetical protein
LIFLSRLNTVSIDFFYDGLATQHLAVDLFVRHLAIGARNTITSLALTRLARVDFALCSLVARTFPHLVDLRLSCTERLDPGCCWECLEESASTMVHSPIPDVCSDIRVLAVSDLYLKLRFAKKEKSLSLERTLTSPAFPTKQKRKRKNLKAND